MSITFEPATLPPVAKGLPGYIQQPKAVSEFTYEYWVPVAKTPGEIDHTSLRVEQWFSVREASCGGWTAYTQVSYTDKEGIRSTTKGRAGGYGYCKLSASWADAMRKLFPLISLEAGLCNGSGMPETHKLLRALGFVRVV